MEQKINSVPSAETNDDSITIADVITSSPNNAKPFVGSRYLTVKQLYDACKNHNYLLLRFASGYQMGINCKVAAIAQRLKPKEWQNETYFVSYKPCGINEYIEHKHPFKVI